MVTNAHSPIESIARRQQQVIGAGTLSVGPISLGRTLTRASQRVEATLCALGRDGSDVASVRLVWTFADQDADRFWMVFANRLDFVPRYQYRVRLVVQATRPADGIDWEDQEWRDGSGSGALIIALPKPEPPEVVRRDLWSMARSTMLKSPAPLPPMVVGLDDPQ